MVETHVENSNIFTILQLVWCENSVVLHSVHEGLELGPLGIIVSGDVVIAATTQALHRGVHGDISDGELGAREVTTFARSQLLSEEGKEGVEFAHSFFFESVSAF